MLLHLSMFHLYVFSLTQALSVPTQSAAFDTPSILLPEPYCYEPTKPVLKKFDPSDCNQARVQGERELAKTNAVFMSRLPGRGVFLVPRVWSHATCSVMVTVDEMDGRQPVLKAAIPGSWTWIIRTCAEAHPFRRGACWLGPAEEIVTVVFDNSPFALTNSTPIIGILEGIVPPNTARGRQISSDTEYLS